MGPFKVVRRQTWRESFVSFGLQPDEPFGAARRQSGANHSAQSGSSPGANRSGWLGVKLGVSPSARSDFNPDADHLGIRISSPPNHSKRSGSRLGEPSGAIRLQPRRKPLKAARRQSGRTTQLGQAPSPARTTQRARVPSLAAVVLLTPCIAPLLCLYSHKARMY